MLSVTIGDWALANDVSELLEVIAIGTIIVAVVGAAIRALYAALGPDDENAFSVFKQHFARWLLLSLDVLIAADIIRTVTLEPTLENVAALGLLVLVRTFLAWSLVLEIESRWPWQRYEGGSDRQ